MKKYIKPEIEIVSFDVQSEVLAYAAGTQSEELGGAVVDLSALNTQYIPDNVDKKVWGTMEDGENWNWDE